MNSPVEVVLCRPSDARNIGACIRAVANFGGRRLHVISDSLSDRDALMNFSSGALGVVEVHRQTSLADALSGADWVLGTSRRVHDADAAPVWPLPMLAGRLKDRLSVRVLFGNERTGLSVEELDRCDAVVAIPTSEAFPSMNLGHAVAVLMYELARPDTHTWSQEPTAATLTTGATERGAFFDQVAEHCALAGYPPGRSPVAFARRLKKLLTRAQANTAELDMLGGVFRELARRQRP